MLNPSPDNVMRMQAGFCLFSVTEWVFHYILPSRKAGGGGGVEGWRVGNFLFIASPFYFEIFNLNIE